MILVWERPNFHSSPSISRSLDACLQICGMAKEQIDFFDFYSYTDQGTLETILALNLGIVAFPSSQSLHADILGFPRYSHQNPSRYWED